MPLNFGQMQADLALAGMAQLLNTDFGALLNRAQAEEVDEYEWSFRLTNVVLYSDAPYSTGTISLTPGSGVVTGSGTTWTSAYNGFQLRFGTAGMALPNVTIINAATLNLSQPYMGAALTNVSYSLTQSYYPIPGAAEITAVKNTIYLDKVSRETLNLQDPQRLSVGGNPSLAWAPAPYATDGSGNLQIELWPVPSAVVPYVVEYRQAAIPMVASTDMPMVSSSVLEAKAMMYAAMALFASNGAPQWAQLAASWERTYLREREDARFADRKRALTQKPSNPVLGMGLDFLPTHDIN